MKKLRVMITAGSLSQWATKEEKTINNRAKWYLNAITQATDMLQKLDKELHKAIPIKSGPKFTNLSEDGVDGYDLQLEYQIPADNNLRSSIVGAFKKAGFRFGGDSDTFFIENTRGCWSTNFDPPRKWADSDCTITLQGAKKANAKVWGVRNSPPNSALLNLFGDS